MKNLFSIPAFDYSKNVLWQEKEPESSSTPSFSDKEKKMLEIQLKNLHEDRRTRDSIKNVDGSTTETKTYVKPGEMAGKSTTTTYEKGTFHNKTDMLTTGLAATKEEEDKKWENISKKGGLPSIDTSISSNLMQRNNLQKTIFYDFLGHVKITNNWEKWNDFVNKKGPTYKNISKAKGINKKALDAWMSKNLKEYNPK